MIKKILSSILFTGIIFSFPSAVNAATYYVSPTGSGTSCTSTLPCSQSTGYSKLVTGDTLYFKSGTYLQTSKFYISKSGITLATAPGEPSKAFISGDNNGNGQVDGLGTGYLDGPRTSNPTGTNKYYPLVQITASNVTFKDLEVGFSSGRGVQAQGTNITLSGLYVHHAWDSAVNLFGSYNLIENSTVWRSAESNYCGGTESYRQCNGNWPGGIVVGDANAATSPGSGHHSTIRSNTIYNTSGEGLLCMHTENVNIDGNVIYDNWAANVDLDKCGDSVVQNNLIYYSDDKVWWRSSSSGSIPSTPKSGILLSNETTNPAGDPYPCGWNHKIFNNILVGNGANIKFWSGDGNFTCNYMQNSSIANNTLVEARGTAISIDDTPYAHVNNQIVNNIVMQTGGNLTSGSMKGFTFNNNLWSRSPSTTFLGTNSLVANPLLENPVQIHVAGQSSVNFYKLKSSSPAIDKGKYLSDISKDYFGVSRPQNGNIDIGAHEYPGSVVSTPTPTIKIGDANNDGLVDDNDYSIWFGNRFKQILGPSNADFDNNGVVEGVDYTLWLINFGK